MPFIPHTESDIKAMLDTIGVKSIEDLFDEIPQSLRHSPMHGVPSGLSEMALARLMRERAAKDAGLMCFLGAGSYEHHIPAAVWEVAARGEFYTAYTPYQAEASQGGLQLLYEYQTMMASLMSMDVSNASLYDGATGLAEAVLMAVRIKNKKRILMPRTLHPNYRETVQAIVQQQQIELVDVPYDAKTGCVDLAALKQLGADDVAALVIPQPNFFGVLDDVDALTRWAEEQNILTIAVVNPLAMSLLKPPGQWGDAGADIACGEGQPLGIPMMSGGPYYGFLTCKQKHVRQMPGRIIGRTVDKDGKEGFVLTLQAREQHIRRGKARSNICTNQGLMVTASTIFMSLMGPDGLKQMALVSHERTKQLRDAMAKVNGVEVLFAAPFFHEVVVRCHVPVKQLTHQLAAEKIQAGFVLDEAYPELQNCLLLCATETKTEEDIATFVKRFEKVLQQEASSCPAA